MLRKQPARLKVKHMQTEIKKGGGMFFEVCNQVQVKFCEHLQDNLTFNPVKVNQIYVWGFSNTSTRMNFSTELKNHIFISVESFAEYLHRRPLVVDTQVAVSLWVSLF